MTGAIAMICVGATINTIDNIKNGRDPFFGILASGILMWACVGLNTFSDLGTMFAAVFLVTSFLEHGTIFINLLTTVTDYKPARENGK